MTNSHRKSRKSLRNHAHTKISLIGSFSFIALILMTQNALAHNHEWAVFSGLKAPYVAPHEQTEAQIPTNELEFMLFQAVEQGSSDMVRELLAGGADPNFVGQDGFTPLILAAHIGDIEVVRALLVSGWIDLSVVNANGKTAIAEAIAQGHSEVARILKKRAVSQAQKDVCQTGLFPMTDCALARF